MKQWRRLKHSRCAYSLIASNNRRNPPKQLQFPLKLPKRESVAKLEGGESLSSSSPNWVYRQITERFARHFDPSGAGRLRLGVSRWSGNRAKDVGSNCETHRATP